MKKIIPDEVAGYINMTCDMDKRRENVVYEDEIFICVKDARHRSETDYHYTAWCKKDLRSLLDLERKHVNYLKNIKSVIYQKFNLTDENTENFIHFVLKPFILPINHEFYFINDIINLLEVDEDFYRTNVFIAKL